MSAPCNAGIFLENSVNKLIQDYGLVFEDVVRSDSFVIVSYLFSIFVQAFSDLCNSLGMSSEFGNDYAGWLTLFNSFDNFFVGGAVWVNVHR